VPAQNLHGQRRSQGATLGVASLFRIGALI
jgi:hypothetical protein